jgi:hypothetical protein
MTEAKLCYWCHEPLPPLLAGASYVDELNHYIHEHCREERDESNRRREELRVEIEDGSIDSIPTAVREAVLDRLKESGFSRRCPCLYDPTYGFQGYGSHSYSSGEDGEIDDYDARSSVAGCELCDGSGTFDPLPQLLALRDDAAASAWVAKELSKSSESCDRWRAFPEPGWYFDSIGYRASKGGVQGVMLYNPDLMLGGVVSWLEIADLFRPRAQSSLF